MTGSVIEERDLKLQITLFVRLALDVAINP
jgi:hypothetical protein